MYIIISTGDFLLPKQGNGIGSKCSCTAYGLPRLLHGHARGRKDQVPSLCYIFECLYWPILITILYAQILQVIHVGDVARRSTYN